MTGTNYQKFINVFSPEFDEILVNIKKMSDSFALSKCRGESLDNIGEMFDYSRSLGESDEDYRLGIRNIIELNANAGTKPALIKYISQYLRIDKNEVIIKEEVPRIITVHLPQEFSTRAEDLYRNVKKFIVSGTHVQFEFGGSFWDEAIWDAEDSTWG